MKKMIYDIRSSKVALQTLVRLTNVPANIWEQYLGKERDYRYTEDLVEEVINKHGHLPANYRDFEFIYFHITTSSNSCASFYKYGILDLKESYSRSDSELRMFLEQNNISIDLNACTLTYGNKQFDISYGKSPRQYTQEYYCWCIGRKFFYDYTTCGFLSIWDRSPYGGYVHHRPEILSDIDNLLGLNLSSKWAMSHAAYEIVVKISGEYIVYNSDDDNTDEEKVIDYLTRAYLTAFGEPHEDVLLIKNGIQIPPSNILQINRFTTW